jgi:hypothetical protein
LALILGRGKKQVNEEGHLAGEVLTNPVTIGVGTVTADEWLFFLLGGLICRAFGQVLCFVTPSVVTARSPLWSPKVARPTRLIGKFQKL